MPVTFMKTRHTLVSMKYNDTKIVEGILQDNEKVLLWVFQNYGPLLYGIIYKAGGNHDVAKEVFQMTILAVRKNIQMGKYKEQNNLKSYFIGIAKKIWWNKLRKEKSNRKISISEKEYALEDESAFALEAKIVKDKQISLLYRGLQMLGKDCKELIEVHYYENVKLIDIAQERGKKPSNIRVNIMRCRDRLRKIIEQLS